MLKFILYILTGAFPAILRLGDGIEIALDRVGNGFDARRRVCSSICYSSNPGCALTKDNLQSVIAPNILSTFWGQLYAMILSDVRKVWLNANSSLSYPIAFIGNENCVEVSGDVSCEMPFNARLFCDLMLMMQWDG